MKRHPFDPFAFVSGVLFVGLALFVLSGGTLADMTGVWAVAIPAMVLASLIVLSAGRRLVARDRPASDDEQPDPD